MTTTAKQDPRAEQGKRPPRVMRGMAWLVWRQHRTAFVACLLLAAASCVNMLWQRGTTRDFLARARTDGTAVDVLEAFQGAQSSAFQSATWTLSLVPVVAGVFLGAPLISGDRERGTVKLVTTQSMTRGRWILTKLGLAALVTLVCSAALSAVFTWWWEPAHLYVNSGHWDESGVFDNTGPMLVAMALLHFAAGAALGMFLRRTVVAMVLTFGFAYAVEILWDTVRPRLGTARTLTSPVEAGRPKLPEGAVWHDEWTVDAHGGLHGFGTCFNESTPEGCRANEGIVAHRLEYFGYDQMNAMQWTGAAILLALTAAILTFTVWWARRRPL
ncbi:ABC transporter permease subunit [Streptomyces albireticuli]|nr:ABC transporter permease subunit [Streptomyces albireticuli]MCD9141031.1 ABC transporter permease [Streptomyces albireticuli]MCD9161007.1 ABC transporter permease [Streptomyces albireticuli]MCD9190935.1 ABC transporter permease [Streptomyces albireticuli]